MALSSHLLFSYADRLSFEFHLDSIRELVRVAPEVRVFPLVAMGIHRYPLLDRLRTELDAHGVDTTVHTVEYEFQRGANEMLVCQR